jgi:hypothetical protein
MSDDGNLINVEIGPQITRMSFVRAFTARPKGAGPMPKEELMDRLTLALTACREQTANHDPKKDRPIAVIVSNCLCGALIRMAQAYGDPGVEFLIDVLVEESVNTLGV